MVINFCGVKTVSSADKGKTNVAFRNKTSVGLSETLREDKYGA